MKKTVLIALASVLAIFIALVYFEFPLNLIRPVFHTDVIEHCAREFDLDPLLITSIIKVESNFFRRARSNRGAIGLMQILPSTALELAPELGYKDYLKIDLENPDTNIHFGSMYLKKLLTEFNGNVILAIASYNAGRTKVRGWYLQNPLVGVDYDDIPYKETRNYVKNVMRTYNSLSKIHRLANRISSGKS